MKFASPAFFAAFGLLSLGNQLQAAVLTQYTFAGVPTGSETGTQYNPLTTAAGFTATAVTDGGANVTLNTEVGSLGYTSPVLKIKPGTGSTAVTTAAQAFSSNTYATFTLSSAVAFNLTNLTFDAARGGGSTTRGFVIQSSVGGFGSSGAVLSQVNSIPTAQPTLTNYVIDLSAPAFQGLTNIEFRIYGFSDGFGASVDFDNITVNGVPEPGTLLLSGVALAAGVLRRSRRR
jgi:hypothetical protein